MSDEREHIRTRLDTGPHTKVGPDATVSVRAGAKVRGLDGEVIGEVTGVVLNDDGVFIDMAVNPGTLPGSETPVSLPDPPGVPPLAVAHTEPAHFVRDLMHAVPDPDHPSLFIGRSMGQTATCVACGCRVDEKYTDTHTEVCPGLVSRARRVQIERDLIAESFKPWRGQPANVAPETLFEDPGGGDRIVYKAAESVFVCFLTENREGPEGEWMPGWRPTVESWRDPGT